MLGSSDAVVLEFLFCAAVAWFVTSLAILGVQLWRCMVIRLVMDRVFTWTRGITAPTFASIPYPFSLLPSTTRPFITRSFATFVRFRFLLLFCMLHPFNVLTFGFILLYIFGGYFVESFHTLSLVSLCPVLLS
ncbi:hypothetical protein B0T14DRAFT_524055 [Immersiella caudata]|uniref:Uncharacterized protein n=1 Tax=Immersiella caudata TaxID=314043 RepID=A0AA40BX87_9PEZI|nr:hypothetical protein B0T14DRAFT_524055 [Immersiella caudata]